MIDYHDRFDRQLKHDLNNIANTIETPTHLLKNIKTEINKQERSEKIMNKPFLYHRKFKSIAVVTLCTVLLIGGIVGAKSLIDKDAKGFLSSSDTLNTIDDTLISNLGFEPKMPDILLNNYKRMKIENAEYINGSNQQQPIDSSQKLISAYYENGDTGQKLSLSVSNTSKDSDMFSNYGTIKLDDVALQYKSYDLYILPSDYELTEEDKEKEKNDEAFFVYLSGIEEKQIQKSQCMKWIDRGIYYQIDDHDNSLSKEQMIEIAQYIKDSKQ